MKHLQRLLGGIEFDGRLALGPCMAQIRQYKKHLLQWHPTWNVGHASRPGITDLAAMDSFRNFLVTPAVDHYRKLCGQPQTEHHFLPDCFTKGDPSNVMKRRSSQRAYPRISAHSPFTPEHRALPRHRKAVHPARRTTAWRSNSDQRYIPPVDSNSIWARTSLTANNGAHPQLDLGARWKLRSALRLRSSTSRSSNDRMALYSDQRYIPQVDSNSIWAHTSLTATNGANPQLDLGARWTELGCLARRSTSLTRSLLLAEKLAGLLLGLSARST